jgi:hypothetical protein
MSDLADCTFLLYVRFTFLACKTIDHIHRADMLDMFRLFERGLKTLSSPVSH